MSYRFTAICTKPMFCDSVWRMSGITHGTEKQAGYYESIRSEIAELLPKSASRVLDVGCGHGKTAAWLRDNRIAKHVFGIELLPSVAEKARERLDQVYVGSLEELAKSNADVGSDYDLILCLDVIEHLVNPWDCLKFLKTRLSPNGVLIASIPNIRHFSVLTPLLLKGEFTYEESGIMDSTHLRFFTKKSATKLLQDCGFVVEKVSHTGRPRFSETWFIDKLTLGLFQEFFDFQYLFRASSPD